MPAVSLQSVPITIETEQLSFFMFKTGVNTASSWTKLDHRVLSWVTAPKVARTTCR